MLNPVLHDSFIQRKGDRGQTRGQSAATVLPTLLLGVDSVNTGKGRQMVSASNSLRRRKLDYCLRQQDLGRDGGSEPQSIDILFSQTSKCPSRDAEGKHCRCTKIQEARWQHIWTHRQEMMTSYVLMCSVLFCPFVTILFPVDDCFYYHSWRNNVVIAFGTLSSFFTQLQ